MEIKKNSNHSFIRITWSGFFVSLFGFQITHIRVVGGANLNITALTMSATEVKNIQNEHSFLTMEQVFNNFLRNRNTLGEKRRAGGCWLSEPTINFLASSSDLASSENKENGISNCSLSVLTSNFSQEVQTVDWRWEPDVHFRIFGWHQSSVLGRT